MSARSLAASFLVTTVAVAVALGTTSARVAAQSAWSTPFLESTLNSTATDTGPSLSFDGLTLHFSSFRSGNYEIYVSTRAFPGAPWSAPAVVTELADPAVDDQPFLAVGDLEIFFSSSRPGTAGGSDVMRATRTAVGQPWGTPTFVTELNGAGAEAAFSMTADGLEAFFLSTSWGGSTSNNNVIVTASRTSTALPFGTPTVVAELATGNTHRDCEISADGLRLTWTEFVSPRLKVMHAERPDRTQPFGTPVVWTEFDTVGPSLGVYSFTQSLAEDEAVLAAGYSSALGGQELMSTRRSMPYGSGCGAAAPLTLACNVPVIGGSWDLSTSNVDPVSPVVITFFGTLQAAVPLAVIGAPGCSAWVDGIVASPTSPVAAGSSLLSVPVPPNPALSGAQFFTQSACLTLANPLNLHTSNGVRSTVGF
jgi:hypothetical protein